MRVAVLLLTVLLAVPAMLVAAEKPKGDEMVNNPPYAHWSAFTPGTTVTQREVVTLQNGTKMQQTISQKLVSREKDTVVVETSMTESASGGSAGVAESTKTLTSFPAKVKMSDVDSGNDASVSVTEGTDTVEVKGKKIETEWVEAVTRNGDWITTEKVWTARDVPGGIVKRTITRKKGHTTVSDSVLDIVEYK